jgi:hypothetical protein
MGEFLNEASSPERYGKSTGSSSHPNIPNDVTPRLTRHTNKLYYAGPQELITLQGRARVAVVYITPEDRCDHWTGTNSKRLHHK